MSGQCVACCRVQQILASTRTAATQYIPESVQISGRLHPLPHRFLNRKHGQAKQQESQSTDPVRHPKTVINKQLLCTASSVSEVRIEQKVYLKKSCFLFFNHQVPVLDLFFHWSFVCFSFSELSDDAMVKLLTWLTVVTSPLSFPSHNPAPRFPWNKGENAHISTPSAVIPHIRHSYLSALRDGVTEAAQLQSQRAAAHWNGFAGLLYACNLFASATYFPS